MGIYDRDWVRTGGGVPRGGGHGVPGGQGALARVRMFSATTWIIIACAAVFIVDGFMKPYGAQLEKPGSWTLVGLESSVKLDGTIRVDPPLNEPPADWSQIGPGTFQAQRHLFVGESQVGTATFQNMSALKRWGFFSTATAIVGVNASGGLEGAQFWRVISFQFLHAGFWHVFVNMFGLWIFGPLVERKLGRKRFLAFYLLCGIFGAFLYLLLNAAGTILAGFGMDSIPFLLPNDTHLPLIGASAGVFGVLFAGAYLAPNMTVLLFFLIPMRLATLAYGLVILSLYALWTNGANAGGEAAHLGGAIAGFYFIRHQHHLHGFFDFIGRVDPTSRSSKARRISGGGGVRRSVEDSEIDRILAKIHEKGLNSLTAKEKRILRDSSKR
jgi:membrane associated rhomboid family serine protease